MPLCFGLRPAIVLRMPLGEFSGVCTAAAREDASYYPTRTAVSRFLTRRAAGVLSGSTTGYTPSMDATFSEGAGEGAAAALQPGQQLRSELQVGAAALEAGNHALDASGGLACEEEEEEEEGGQEEGQEDEGAYCRRSDAKPYRGDVLGSELGTASLPHPARPPTSRCCCCHAAAPGEARCIAGCVRCIPAVAQDKASIIATAHLTLA
jgi:hypothetical protein